MRLSNNLICIMALTRGVKNEELNFIFKSLAEISEDGEIYKKYYDSFTGQFFPELSSKSSKSERDDNDITFWAYGSAAEGLQCYDTFDAGDIDVMVFSNSDNLMIHEEMLEYSSENPLHVRIKGDDHPVLQSHLVEDTEYVATSALKNVPPALFGYKVRLLVDVLSFITQLKSREEVPLGRLAADLKNSATSPAVTLNMYHFVDNISKCRGMFKVDSPNCLLNEAAAEVECIVHFLWVVNAIEYTRELAEFLDEVLIYVRLSLANMLTSSIHFIFNTDIDDRRDKLIAKFNDICSRTPNATRHTNDQHVVTPAKCDQKESQANDEPHARNTPQNCVVDRKSSEHLESTLTQSTMPRNSTENFYQLSEKAISKDVIGSESVVVSSENTEKSGDYNVNKNKRKPKRTSQVLKDKLTFKDLPRKANVKEEEETRELERRLFRWPELMFGKITENKDTMQIITCGVDLIPAFRSFEWPKNAKEWIKRERKWPSPDIVDRVIQEGFHLVVKSPKNNGNPECDFRISFSHAEYLLSREINGIQRECYRCLKRCHRAYLSTEPKSLVSFHLKNVFLQTIEETGGEMWTENNRAECMMKLLGNLLKALTKKELPHFFVRSYNLFGVDYIENPDILQSLAGKVEQFMESPMRFATMIIQSQSETKQEKKQESVSKKKLPRSEAHLSGKPGAGHQHANIGESISKGSCDSRCTKEKVTAPFRPTEVSEEYCPVYRYHDLKDIYQGVTKKLVAVAFDDDDCRLKATDLLEASLVKEVRQLARKYGIPVGAFPRVLDSFWHKRAYYWIWISTEPDIRQRVLVAVKGLFELMKYHLKEDDFWEAQENETVEALLNRMLHPCAPYPSHLNDALPSDNFLQLLHKGFEIFHHLTRPQVYMKRFLAEKLREVVRQYLDLTDPFSNMFVEVFDLFLENCCRVRISHALDILYYMLSVIRDLWKSMKSHAQKKDDVRQENSDDTLSGLYNRIRDLVISYIPRPAQQKVASNTDDIPLD